MRFPGLVCAVILTANAIAAEPIEFNRDVRPILSDNCFQCHGPDRAHRKAKLRLDDRDSATAKGAIVPGQAAASELVARIDSADPDVVMPPPDSLKKLTPAQRDTLRRWIDQGANYQPHWAYIPPTRPAVPAAGHPIDAFVRAKLAAKGVQPSPPAEPRTLLRRLSLDLTGLPPTPEEAEAFARDPSPENYARQIDRLLASPHFGERMAVPWLDLVRFADTVGYHGDQNVNVFPYRDYVIDSYNTNKPFDRFTVEQLAGDLLPNPSDEQLTATGFNRLNMMTREGGAQPKEYLTKYAADRVRTVATTWLGATMGCAECHDHKFDPITARDFYATAAFFADVKQWGVYADYTYTPNPDLRGYNNDYPFPPERLVPNAAMRRRDDAARAAIAELAARTNADAAWSERLRAWLADHPNGWAELEPAATATVSGKKQPDGRKFTLTPPAGRFAAVRLQLAAPVKSATLQVSFARRRGGKDVKLSVYFADADAKLDRYSSGHAVHGVHGGWRTDPAKKNQSQTAVYLFDGPADFAGGDELVVNVTGGTGVVVTFAVSAVPFADPARAVVDDELRSAVAAGDRALSLRGAADKAAFARYKELHRELLECRGGRAFTVVTEAWEPRPVRVLPRGNWMDETGEVVAPAVPKFLGGSPSDRRLTRLDLANWLVSPDNPLTARVFVNRLWQQFFGTGLSNVLDDLGTQGEPPSHPELLDWLAVEFRESGWDVKRMVKLIVTSSAYQQSSKARPELRDIDPANRLLAFQSPRRLDAEFVRDNALFVAGLLNVEFGGPSAKPYQPGGYYENLQFPDRDYAADRDRRQYRRGVYSHWQRTFLHPMLANFDAPSRDETCACRPAANTPQQALTLLNDPTFAEAARALAERVCGAAAGDGERIDRAFALVLARPASAAERESLERFLQRQRSHFAANPSDAAKRVRVGYDPVAEGVPAAELAAWSEVGRVVLNLHETITRY